MTARVNSSARVVLGGFRREHLLQELNLLVLVSQPAL